MSEAQAIGEALGIRFRLPIEKRIAGAEAIGKHKTSMLQDIEAGRAIEIDALLGSVLELGAHHRRGDAASRSRLRAGETDRPDASRAARPARGSSRCEHRRFAHRGFNVCQCSTFEEQMSFGEDDHPAIEAPDRRPLSFGALRSLIDETVASLNAFGVGRGDRVAIVLPNGPEMAAAFVAIAAGARAAPLNPAYRAEEFEFYMSDLGAKALVVEAGGASAAIEPARKLGVVIVELRRQAELGAGAFALDCSDVHRDGRRQGWRRRRMSR